MTSNLVNEPVVDGDHELRCEPRYKVSHAVTLVFGRDFDLCIQARVDNLSAKGALLIVNPFAVLPKYFLIVDRVENLFDLAKVAWRSDEKCGVALIRNFDLATPSPARNSNARHNGSALTEFFLAVD